MSSAAPARNNINSFCMLSCVGSCDRTISNGVFFVPSVRTVGALISAPFATKIAIISLDAPCCNAFVSGLGPTS